MPRITAGPAEVLDYLLQRSGIIREPVPGRIDFVHRTFQEYLAARQAADNADVEPLVARAHLDPWRETIIMAAGHANAPLRRELLTGLLNRADAEPRHSHRLRLLVTACLETSPDIPADLRSRVDRCVESLIPPKNAAEARPLSQAGEEIVRRLPDSLAGLSTAEAIATIRTTWMINGPEALRKLAHYAADPRIKVQDELITGWDYFDPVEYARQVLAEAPLHRGRIDTESTAALPAMSMLRNLHHLRVQLPKGMALSCLAGVPSLYSLSAKGITLDSMGALSEHKQLRTVVLSEIYGMIEDLSPLLGLPKLEELYLYPDRSIPDIGFVARLPKLTHPRSIRPGTYQGFLANHNTRFTPRAVAFWLPRSRGHRRSAASGSLRRLSLRHSRLGPNGLERIIDTFPQLEYLQLQECDWLTDLNPIARLPLKTLILGRMQQVADLEVIRSLSQLEQIWLIGMPIAELNAIAELKLLRRLEVRDCTDVADLTPLAALPRLRHLVLAGVADDLDLSPLHRARNLSIQLREGQRVTGTERLHKSTRIEWHEDDWDP